MSDLVPAHRYASLFGTNRFGRREDVVEEYEIAAGFDWAKKRVAALLQRIEALLNESKARGVLILVWLSQHVFVASFYPGEVQNAVYLYRRPDLVTDQPQAHEGIHNTTVARLDFQFPGNKTCFCSYAVGFDPFLTILAVEQPLQECLRIWFSNKELSVEQGRLLGLFYGTLFLWGCIFRVGGIAFARSLHENPNQRPRRIIIHGLLRRALEVNMHLDSFVVGSDIPRGTTLSGIFAVLKLSGPLRTLELHPYDLLSVANWNYLLDCVLAAIQKYYNSSSTGIKHGHYNSSAQWVASRSYHNVAGSTQPNSPSKQVPCLCFADQEKERDRPVQAACR